MKDEGRKPALVLRPSSFINPLAHQLSLLPIIRINLSLTGFGFALAAAAQRYGVQNILDPMENINGGVRYLRDLIAMFNGNLELAVAAYNAGENAVIRHGNRIPPYAETVHYVPKVLGFYRQFQTRKG